MKAAFIAFLLLLVSGASAPAFDLDSTPGRLPKSVVPLHYAIAIVPHVASKTFNGQERISLLVRKKTDRIVFNTLDQTIGEARVDGRRVKRILTQNDKQLTTLILSQPLSTGSHVLQLSYAGKIDTAPQGLFIQRYRTRAEAGYVLTTMFESTDARRMFPCWDEPAFRATFTLTATVPAAWKAVANMPIARRIVRGSSAIVTFGRTPKIPTYLVEFTAGDLERISARHDGIEHSVWTIRGQTASARYALANSQAILDDYNAYFGFRYPLPKLDSIAVPGGFPGAMENWGAITYNERLLLTGPNTTFEDRQIVFDVQAHEMAHQWTGDLVTLDWWSDIWLNESFAAWMEHKETALRNPTWKWMEAMDEDKEEAMDADAQPTSLAIQEPVKNELQAEASFNPAIVYAKGAAVLRMLEAYLGPDTFRDGIRRYMRARAFSNADGSDLWNALSAASGQDIAALANAWITQPGYPVVSVNANATQATNVPSS
ncbi:MAG: M1 family metallopeptidase [Polyangiaceae bacterium]